MYPRNRYKDISTFLLIACASAYSLAALSDGVLAAGGTAAPPSAASKDRHDHAAGGKKIASEHLTDRKPPGLAAHGEHKGHGDETNPAKKSDPKKQPEPPGHTDHSGHANDENMRKDAGKSADAHAAGKDQRGAHGKHGAGEPDQVKLTPAQLREFAITTSVAAGGNVAAHIVRPAEVKFNEDRIVHVIPRVDGTVKSVTASEGQYVKEGTLMAVLDSRDLADAKAEFLAAIARLALAKENYDRAEGLSRRKIVAQRLFQESRAIFIEAQIKKRVAAQKLVALGLSVQEIKDLPKAPDSSLPLLYMKAPYSGLIVERHIVRGETRSVDKEALTSRKAAFVIADLSKVWVDISIYPKDFSIVRKGQKVRILMEDGGPAAIGRILFVSPHVQEETRTGYARVVLDNSSGRFHPGVYLKAEIATSARMARIRIPKEAVQNGVQGKVVFVKKGGAFVPRPIEIGLTNSEFVEVASGLDPGETYVTTGAFTLKAQIGKAGFGDGHNH